MAMMDVFSFKACGIPQPAGSKRGFPIRRKNGKIGVSITDANPKSADWKTLVSLAASEQFHGDLMTGPLHVRLKFCMPRPKGHYGTGKNADRVKDSAPEFPTTKPDVLKLARAVEDALTGIVYGDDAQIVMEDLQKCYDTNPRVVVSVTRLAFLCGQQATSEPHRNAPAIQATSE